MSNMIRNKLIGVVWGLGAVSMLAVAGVANAATVSLTPSVTNVAVGDIFSLTVQGSDFVDGVSSGGVEISWDANLVSLVSTLPDIQNSLLSNGFLDLGSSVAAADAVAVGGSFAGITGPSFDFVTLQFEALPPAQQGPINLANSIFGDWQDINGQSLPGVIFEGATINTSAVPVPAAVWLFGSGLLGLVGVARRRSA